MLKKFGILLIIMIALMLLFNNILMPWYVKHSNLVKVPNVTGLNFLDAKKVLEQSGLDVKQGDVRYDESKPIGFVMDQAPAVDEMVKNGRRVYLTVCGGEQLMEVPRLIGKSERDAKFTLVQRNLQVGEIVRKFTTEQPEDVVVSQVIQPGSKVKKGTKVDLIISNGALLGNIIIPDVVGKTLAVAKKLLEEKKLKVGKITYQSSDMPVGSVIDQYPKKDKSAKDNTPVDLFIAKKKIDTDKAFEDIGDNDNKVNKEKANPPDEKDKKEKIKPADDKPKDKQDKSTDKTKEKVTDKPKEKAPDKTKEKTPDKK
jgi:beta-lactam-binding protein with PASTA domain